MFRLAALWLGLSPLLLAELLLAALGWGTPDLHDDPFVGFRAIRPLFVLSADGLRYEIPPARQNYFRPQTFASAKPPDEFRVFCLGGSTVQGRPYATETSFTSWLEIALQQADTSRRWRIVNCGGVSYASYRLVPILAEVLRYEPDLIVVYTGHNEFLEDRTYAQLSTRSPALGAAVAAASQLHSFCLLRAAWQRGFAPANVGDSAHRQVLPQEVQAILDFRRGLDQYHRDPVGAAGVTRHFETNLRRMVALAQARGVPILLVNPVSNLRDCPPFKSEHRSDLLPADLRRWEELWEAARAAYGSDLQRAIQRLNEAAAIDDQYAAVHFQLGQCYDALSDAHAARRHYLLAKERDICPLRMTEPLHSALARVARDTGTPLVDVRTRFERESRNGIPGDSLMMDHVHPSIRGHQMIAGVISQQLVRAGVVQPTAGWEQRCDEAFAAQLATLEPIYFEQARMRLEHLQQWARGLSTRDKQSGRASGETAR